MSIVCEMGVTVNCGIRFLRRPEWLAASYPRLDGRVGRPHILRVPTLPPA